MMLFYVPICTICLLATLNINNKEKSKKVLKSIKKSTKSKVITVPVSIILEFLELSIHTDIFLLSDTLIYYFNFLTP